MYTGIDKQRTWTHTSNSAVDGDGERFAGRGGSHALTILEGLLTSLVLALLIVVVNLGGRCTGMRPDGKVVEARCRGSGDRGLNAGRDHKRHGQAVRGRASAGNAVVQAIFADKPICAKQTEQRGRGRPQQEHKCQDWQGDVPHSADDARRATAKS